MLHEPRAKSARHFLPALLALLMTAASPIGAPPDPLAAEIERCSAYLRDHVSKDEIWIQVKEAETPVVAGAGEALRAGRRLLALQRLAGAWMNLRAAEQLARLPAAALTDEAGLEKEWKRQGRALRDELKAASPAALDGVVPAAVRGIGEAALPQIRIYYDASLDYGRSTMPEEGLFYLAAAQAQRDFAAFCRGLSAPSGRRPPPLRDLGPDLDRLEGDLLALYRPPLSIDRHRDFIGASSTLKEAKELNAGGLRYGALLRYLDATLRFALLRPDGPPAMDSAELRIGLRDLDTRLSQGDTDHSIGRVFLESAQADADAPADGAGPVKATAILREVLPRYFDALAPPKPEGPRPAPRVTVTLVRWPYT